MEALRDTEIDGGAHQHPDGGRYDAPTFTSRVEEIWRESGMVNVPVFGNTLHTTTELTVNEDLEDLDDDLLESVRELVPVARLYCSRK